MKPAFGLEHGEDIQEIPYANAQQRSYTLLQVAAALAVGLRGDQEHPEEHQGRGGVP